MNPPTNINAEVLDNFCYKTDDERLTHISSETNESTSFVKAIEELKNGEYTEYDSASDFLKDMGLLQVSAPC